MINVFNNLFVVYEWQQPAEGMFFDVSKNELVEGQYPVGYYWSDETSLLCGPYPDSGTALAASDNYANQL